MQRLFTRVSRRPVVSCQRRAASTASPLEEYNNKLKAQINVGTSDSVTQLLDEMTQQGVQPNLETYKAVLNFYREDWKKNGKSRQEVAERQNQEAIDQLVGEVIAAHEEEHGPLEKEEKEHKWWKE